MNYYQEKIETDSIIPAGIYTRRAKEGNCYYPMHWHDNLEFDLVLQGMIKAKLKGREVEVYPGDFLFVNSGELHETDADNKEEIRSITILLSYNLLKEYCSDIDLYYFDFKGNEAAKNKIKNLILECAYLYEEKKEFYEIEISIVLRRICSILLKECRKEEQEITCNRYEENNMINIKKAISYMEENYQNDLSLKDIAYEIGMAPTYFSRFFKKTTGETFYCYLNKMRLYYAHKELINSDASITEVALNNGFSNVKAFIETFKKAYKLTPAKYKSEFIN